MNKSREIAEAAQPPAGWSAPTWHDQEDGELDADEREEQRRNLAHLNAKISNPRVTREMIDAAAMLSAAESSVELSHFGRERTRRVNTDPPPDAVVPPDPPSQRKLKILPSPPRFSIVLDGDPELGFKQTEHGFSMVLSETGEWVRWADIAGKTTTRLIALQEAVEAHLATFPAKGEPPAVIGTKALRVALKASRGGRGEES